MVRQNHTPRQRRNFPAFFHRLIAEDTVLFINQAFFKGKTVALLNQIGRQPGNPDVVQQGANTQFPQFPV